jgi:hypothetical protein
VAAGSPIPDDCVLVPRATLIMLADELKRLKQIERLPSFLTADHLRRHA